MQRIVLLPGDGIGPEVIDQARRVLEAVAYAQGLALEFAEELIGAYFTMRNPNAASTCGCGVSFSVG